MQNMWSSCGEFAATAPGRLAASPAMIARGYREPRCSQRGHARTAVTPGRSGRGPCHARPPPSWCGPPSRSGKQTRVPAEASRRHHRPAVATGTGREPAGPPARPMTEPVGARGYRNPGARKAPRAPRPPSVTRRVLPPRHPRDRPPWSTDATPSSVTPALMPRLVPGRPAARRLAVHHQVPRAVLPLRCGRWAVARHPGDDDPPGCPRVTVLARQRIAPPGRPVHVHATIRTQIRADSVS
jgi:hypothetical protein